MHGRLKVKTTAEQEAEKQKEREIKKQKYSKGLKAVFHKRENNELDDEALTVCGNLLVANPDVTSLWNFRRNILLYYEKSMDSDVFAKNLDSELHFTEMCLLKNPKSYGAWHHRGWILLKSPNQFYDKELELCDLYLQKDERNFHCWDHRRFVIKESKRNLEKELLFTENLIDKNFSNYSAWHYRSKLLPVLYPPEKDTSPYPIREDIFIKELEKVVTAVFTDPSDQSPWFFLRWLINKKQDSPRLVQVGAVSLEEGAKKSLLLIFSQSNCSCLKIKAKIANVFLDPLDWRPFDEKRTVWSCLIPDDADNDLSSIEIILPDCDTISVSLKGNQLPSFQWCDVENVWQTKFSVAVEQCLNKIKEDCLMLDEIDPDNKWVLLSLVDIMSVLDVETNFTKILEFLQKLQVLDPLRRNYYADIRSKVTMEKTLRIYLKNGSSEFSLKDSALTRVFWPQYLCSASKVDFSRNNFDSLVFKKYLFSCQQLLIDE